jgi:hypothetical protein
MIMKKKCTPHIIAVAALTVLVVILGACTTMTPEEREAKRAEQAAQRAEREAREAARLTDGKGGIILIEFTVPVGQRGGYAFRCDLNPSFGAGRDPWVTPYHDEGSFTARRIVDEDGEYLIRYSRLLPPREGSVILQISKNINDWRSKTVYVDNDRTVTVTIP